MREPVYQPSTILRTVHLTGLLVLSFALHAQTIATRRGVAEPLNDFIDRVGRANANEYLTQSTSRVKDADSFKEMREHILTMYKGIEVSHSFVLHSQQFDCIPIMEQPSVRLLGLKSIASPPPALREPISDNRLLEGTVVLTSQFGPGDQFDEFGNSTTCEEYTIPMRRITLEELGRYKTLRQFFAKDPDAAGEAPDPNNPTPPEPVGHLHGVAFLNVPNLGGESFLNLWSPYVNPGATFSLSQQWYIGGEGANLQTVEGGWQVYPDLYLTEDAALFIYWTADNYDNTGCYNLDCPAFVQLNPNWRFGATFSHYSTDSGPQYGFYMQWQLWQGNWWLQLGNDWVGYYPGMIYKGGQLTRNAGRIAYGGEATIPASLSLWGYSASGPWPPMGSGAWADAGYGHAAYQGGIQYIDTSYYWQHYILFEKDESPACYTAIPDAYLGSFVVFGGPGGSVKTCGLY